MTVAESLDPRIFWDVNSQKLDWQNSKQFIIERVLMRGFTRDVKIIFNTYSDEELKDAVLKSKTLDRKTANFMSIKLSIPLEKINVAPEHY